MAVRLIAEYRLGDTDVRYIKDEHTGKVGWQLTPAALTAARRSPRESLRGEHYIDVLPGNAPWWADSVEPLVQWKLVGPSYAGGFTQGHSMRDAPSSLTLRLVEHRRLIRRTRPTVSLCIGIGRV